MHFLYPQPTSCESDLGVRTGFQCVYGWVLRGCYAFGETYRVLVNGCHVVAKLYRVVAKVLQSKGQFNLQIVLSQDGEQQIETLFKCSLCCCLNHP